MVQLLFGTLFSCCILSLHCVFYCRRDSFSLINSTDCTKNKQQLFCCLKHEHTNCTCLFPLMEMVLLQCGVVLCNVNRSLLPMPSVAVAAVCLCTQQRLKHMTPVIHTGNWVIDICTYILERHHDLCETAYKSLKSPHLDLHNLI